ncbi:hypothetical protein AUJ95_08560 [Candidatus Desantisbacteria bacterium CG2_30_40_21]|uniref:DUF6883 domain-containing protein n=3 Tax=unclassified Candidatus Desantisiibacteriota TaxID=3106372 RepID=A0A2M7P077_9BACT|nr:MAG: hypothetical protein AUJ95_08560 [Candidatus Desantisbacteria bacterium CG2_30_40_21]PIP40937.1 MAG: hypothetical protein COX18_05145 [Candidatus Desantisbacteria bacterium CG23_combo_of_CG06-09_8_20_14_all_40_23]PIY18698.1 MAG: hypothetical protein COZ13_09235 [Candidatus Desantisbacteria bacterium CG_4_10_14_3_um_filter_40_18]
MRQIPNYEKAYISGQKLRKYLLSETHAIGKAKAKFFRSLGFNDDNIELFEQELMTIAYTEFVAEEIRTLFGIKYIVDGMLPTPSGISTKIRTIWIVEPHDERPRFITAYPQRMFATDKRSTT